MIKKIVGRGYASDGKDVVAVKTALKKTGHYEVPSYGITPYEDNKMFEAIGDFQADNDLPVTNIMRPGDATTTTLYEMSQADNADDSDDDDDYDPLDDLGDDGDDGDDGDVGDGEFDIAGRRSPFDKCPECTAPRGPFPPGNDYCKDCHEKGIGPGTTWDDYEDDGDKGV